MSDFEKMEKFKEEAAYLAGKPIRMRWWVMFFYLIPFVGLVGIIFGPLISESIRTGAPLGELVSPEAILFVVVVACVCILPIAMRMSRTVVIEQDGLLYQDSFREKHVIPYDSITSYTFRGGRPGGIAVKTSEKEYFFHNDLVGYKYLCEEIMRKVGEDKEVEQKFWRRN